VGKNFVRTSWGSFRNSGSNSSPISTAHPTNRLWHIIHME
jgi:hypothetical protein